MGLRHGLRRLDNVLLPPLARRHPSAISRLPPRLRGRERLILGAAALVLLAGVVAAGTVHPASVRPAAPPVTVRDSAGCPIGAAAQGSAFVGPAPDTRIARYEATRRRILAGCTRSQPSQTALAVVSLTAPVTPRRLATLLVATRVSRVFLLPPGLAALGVVTSAASSAAAVDEALAAAARRLQLAADAALTGPSASSASQAARREQLAAQQLVIGCRCDYAALVTATLTTLARVQADSVVRLVDLAPAGVTSAAATVEPLLPTERTLVTAAPPRGG